MANTKNKKVIVQKVDEAITPISMEDVQNKIIVLRGEPIILDRDVAALYGVQTREINQAVKNNLNKFPVGYTFTLNSDEVKDLRSKILTTSLESAESEQVKPLSD